MAGRKSAGKTPSQPELDPSASKTCNVCPGAVFATSDVAGHRSHFKTDWHRYNVKSKLSNGKLATEREFTLLVEGASSSVSAHLAIAHTFRTGLEDSLSGSASSSEEDDESESDEDEDMASNAARRCSMMMRGAF